MGSGDFSAGIIGGIFIGFAVSLILFNIGGITFGNEEKDGIDSGKHDYITTMVDKEEKLFFLMIGESDCYGLLFQNSTGSRLCLEQDELFDIMNSIKEKSD